MVDLGSVCIGKAWALSANLIQLCLLKQAFQTRALTLNANADGIAFSPCCSYHKRHRSCLLIVCCDGKACMIERSGRMVRIAWDRYELGDEGDI